ncbi:calsenilin-like isoform X3 [Penaeus japonicus]|uniref:calsenilin-like isoform X3 n=1 Tax=Penaeus japonicus TaxID=27405 RepID=UPI001C715AF1|nr:calsenilin-like isoform X3 [Penaeus japonicus]
MATPPDSPYGDFMMTFETVRPVKHRPVKLEELCKQTKFTRQEIRLMYRGFKQECPEGVVQEDTFKEIYAKFFPHGNSSLYAHHVFKAFDLNSNGQISFRDLLVSLSQLLRGNAYDKLKFAFKLYDVNGDGCITKAELTDIVSSVHELMGRCSHNRHRAEREEREASSSLVTVSLSPSSLTDHTAAHSSVRRPRPRPLETLSRTVAPTARRPLTTVSSRHTCRPASPPFRHAAPSLPPPDRSQDVLRHSGLTNQVFSGLDVVSWCYCDANF